MAYLGIAEFRVIRESLVILVGLVILVLVSQDFLDTQGLTAQMAQAGFLESLATQVAMEQTAHLVLADFLATLVLVLVVFQALVALVG